MKISRKLKLEVLKRRASGTKSYELAKAAKVHPTTFASFLHDALPFKDGDARVLRIATVLGVAAKEAFEREGKGRRAQ
jgi:hypothetical protein